MANLEGGWIDLGRVDALARAVAETARHLNVGVELHVVIWSLDLKVGSLSPGYLLQAPDHVVAGLTRWIDDYARSALLFVFFEELVSVRAGLAGPDWGDKAHAYCRAMAVWEASGYIASLALREAADDLLAALEHSVSDEHQRRCNDLVVRELIRVRDQSPGCFLDELLRLFHDMG